MLCPIFLKPYKPTIYCLFSATSTKSSFPCKETRFQKGNPRVFEKCGQSKCWFPSAASVVYHSFTINTIWFVFIKYSNKPMGNRLVLQKG